MTSLSLILPEIGVPDVTEDPKIVTAFSTIQTWANGNIDSANLKAGGVNEDRLSTAVQSLLNQKVSGLTCVVHNTSATLVSGELALMEGSSLTATLPAASTANRTVGVFAGQLASINVAGAEGIYGDFISGSATIFLAQYQHVVLQSNGSNWIIISGEPMRSQKYSVRTERASGASIVPSASRPTKVTGEISLTGPKSAGRLSVQTVVLMEPSVQDTSLGEIRMPVAFDVNPGQEYKWVQIEGSAKLFTSHLVS